MCALPVQPNQSLLEGIEVLLAVARKGGPVGVRPLSRELGMTPTRLQRYLGTLAHCGLLRQFPDRRYGVGAGMHALSAISLSASGLAARAMAVLPQLEHLGCIVAVGVLWRDSVSYLYFQLPESPASRSLGRESDYPAEDSAIGRVLLAQLGDARVREILHKCPGDYLENTLLPALRAIRKNGYARIDRATGETGLAVPVGDPAVAGLAISGRIDRRGISVLVRQLHEISKQLAL
jgi:DNA-binding IclR family transcriptional regulator